MEEEPHHHGAATVEKTEMAAPLGGENSGDGVPGSSCSVSGLQEIQKFLCVLIWGGWAPRLERVK